MSKTVDYYFAPQSPWTYLGHQRFEAMAEKAGASIRVLPVDLGRVFPASGGLPLPKRAPQRQAYRLAELARFSKHLQLPMNIKPKYFPVSGDESAKLIIAVNLHDGAAQAMRAASAIQKACWAEERDISAEDTLREIIALLGLPAERIVQSRSPAVQERYDLDTQRAIDIGVFGAPTYVVNGEMFWGQDRLDFVERKLMS